MGRAALVAWFLGRADEARRRVRQIISTGADSDIYTDAVSQMMATNLRVMLGHPDQTAMFAAQAIALCDEHGFHEVKWWAQTGFGWARAQLGFAEEAIAIHREGISTARESGSLVAITWALTSLAEAEAEAQALAGSVTDALAVIDEALTINPEERYFRPDAFRLRGEIRRKQRNDNLAEIDFREAIALAEGMSAKAWELGAVASLAPLLRDSDRGGEARAALAGIYGWFTEGFDTPDLQEAKALLNELARAGD
jgi:predicted ATPase